MKKQALSLTLAFASLVTISCGGGNSQQEVTTAATSETTTVAPATTEAGYVELPEKDYGGRELVIWYNGNDFEPNIDVAATELNGDVLNDAVFERNQAIEDKYNIVINSSFQTGITSAVRNSVTADYDAVDIILERPNQMFQLGLDGILTPINELPNIDLTQPWWDATILEDTQVGGKNWFAISSMNIHAYGATPVTVFNYTVAEENKVGDLYEVLEAGKWTISFMMETQKSVIRDLNGDTKYDFNDIYGLIANNFSVDCFIGGTGHRFVTRESDGTLELNLVNERFVDIYDAIRRITLTDNGAYLTDRYLGGHYDEEIEKVFEDNRALFWITNLKGVQRRRKMEGSFGVLPMPKLDESQDKYYAHLQMGVGDCITIPATCKDTDTIGRILEDFAYYSHKTVIPAFYDATIIGKSMRDEGSAKTLDILLNNYYYDIGGLLGIVGSFRSPVTSNSEEIVSKLESMSSSYADKVSKLNAAE